MKAIKVVSVICFCLFVGSSCQQEEEMPVTPVETEEFLKLKSMSNYYYSTSVIPDEQFLFFYDEMGRLSSYDRYVPDVQGSGMRHQLRFSLEYGAGLNSAYKISVWEIVEGKPDILVGRRRVTLDALSNFVRDIIYDESGDKVIRESIYTHFDGGYTVKIRQWIEEYGRYGVTIIDYETDTNQNVIKKKIYASHFEGSNVEKQVESEFVLTHDASRNPLYNLTPYFAGLNSINRYADSESRNNVITLTTQGCDAEDCSSTFSYVYQNGRVMEVNPGGFMLYKRSFEYYEDLD